MHVELSQVLHAALVSDVAETDPALRPAELLPLLQHALTAAAPEVRGVRVRVRVRVKVRVATLTILQSRPGG